MTNGSEDADYRIMTHRAGTLTDQAKFQSDGAFLVDTAAAARFMINDETTIQSPGGAAIALEVHRATSTSNVQILRLFSDVGSAGNVKFKVDTDGDIATDGSTTIGSPADVAEMYPYRGAEAPEPGTVVRVVPGTPEELARIRADLAVASKESPEHPAVFSNLVELAGRVPV